MIRREEIVQKPILVIGSLNMDLVVTAERLPKEGETIFGKSFATFPGGKGANQAAAAGQFGGAASMAGCIGKDGFGEQLLQSLVKNHVDTTLVRQVDESTGTALITVKEKGANTIVVVAGANANCGEGDIDGALAAFPVPGILLVQHEIPAKSVEYAIRQAKAAGWTVVLNPAPVREVPAAVLALVDLLTPNESEAAALTEMEVTSPEEAVAAGEKLLAGGIKEVVITLGALGAVWVHAAGAKVIPSYKVKAIDTTAAGDSYTAAIAVALAEGRQMEDALKFAAQAAAIVVTRPGAQTALPSREEVEAFAREREGN